MIKKILVVDDSQMIRRLMRTELESGGFHVVEAENGKIALGLIVEEEPDLITLDIEMPLMDGYQTCEAIRCSPMTYQKNGHKVSELPIIFLTANANQEFRDRAFQSGANEYLTKPPVKGEVLQAAQRIQGQKDLLTGLRVLVVEDEENSRQNIAISLKQHGLDVFEAQTSNDAKEVLKREKNDIDLVITAFDTEAVRGLELCTFIRQGLALRDLPVIFLVKQENSNYLMDLFSVGGTDYLFKPFMKVELSARLFVHLQTKILTNELRNNIQKLKESDLLKNDFLAIASHDLRSPLNGILGFCDLLTNKNSDDESAEWLSYIQKSGNFLLELINQLLDLSRLQSQQTDLIIEPVSLLEVAQSCHDTLKHMASPKGITLELFNKTEKEEPLVLVDRFALNQIFNNLVSNAIKFTPSSGSVTISLLQQQESFSVQVQDTGVGISEDMLPYLFEKFTKASQAGTAGEKSIGLGMSICKELVDQLSGQISVESKINQGTIFTVTLPKVP